MSYSNWQIQVVSSQQLKAMHLTLAQLTAITVTPKDTSHPPNSFH